VARNYFEKPLLNESACPYVFFKCSNESIGLQ